MKISRYIWYTWILTLGIVYLSAILGYEFVMLFTYNYCAVVKMGHVYVARICHNRTW